MEDAVIRFDQEQRAWKDWELKAASKYGEATIKSLQFQKDYLSHLEGLEIKYRSTANKYEHVELNILRAKRRETEKVLYPNLLMRLGYRFMRSREMKTAAVAFMESYLSTIDQLKNTLRKKGFVGLEDHLSREIRANQAEFRIPITLQVSETERMLYEFRFCKDTDNGYVIDDIKATLYGKEASARKSMSYNSVSADLSMKQIYNLLSGRAIQKADTWVMLDINDRDAEGNLKPKLFNRDYGFSIEKLVERSGIKGMDDPNLKRELIDNLRQGDSIKVTIGRALVDIEANPVHNSLDKPEVVIARRQEQMQLALQKKPELEEVKKSQSVKMRVG
ncbi:hypothetical protein [Sphingobacterium siyangense]|uniref:hypothetical protein n=1 Tax=Sphingobacterium siyangense TaxID=459529 RepID=UPI002FDED0C3